MADQNKKLHIVIFPWLAFGHMIPFLELAKSIAKRGHKVSFISTPRNINRLPKIPQNLSSLFNFVSLHLPSTDNLPENAEATIDLPLENVQYLKKAYDGLQTELVHFLESSSVDWIIYDFTPHWLPSIAGKLGISRAFFCTVTAWSGVFFGSSITMMNGGDYRNKPEDFLIPPKWVPFPSKVAFRLHELRRYGTHRVHQNISGVSDLKRFAISVIGSDAFLIRSCLELEGDWLKILSDLHQKPILPVGLLPSTSSDCTDDQTDDVWKTIANWLDKHEREKVLYVALGTEVTLSQDELTELATGLELSEVPFFWALRSVESQTELYKLPDGFKERVKDRGMVWTNWTPQVKVLSHDSVGGFLTHCGWSSVVESLQYGKPLLMMPFLGDQGLNARALEEKMVGLEIPRNGADGSVSRNSVAESVRLIMSYEKGNVYKEKAKEIQKIFGDRELHEKYMDQVVQYLQKQRGLSPQNR
ncbi:hypothetical protein M9H77_19595 [Catharanthus roseus]|uniref:Uncharacterized protein n=1 Tax=Catharanthus roseus TaxID=4058 RepID=A0ACC0BAV8_CATRO|nr:hypothetical protein M9H77_19595 [Catharanthus roseus]